MLIEFIVIFIFSVIVLYKFKGQSIFFNDLFWLIYSWLWIIGVYNFGGVTFGDTPDYKIYLYILFVFILFIVFRFFGKKSRLKSLSSFKSRNQNNTNMIYFEYIGVVSAFIYIIDFVLHNDFSLSLKANYNLSIFGTVALFFLPILLVCGLYHFINGISNRKISIKSIILLFLYAMPVLFTSGRSTVFNILIGLISAYFFVNSSKIKKKKFNLKKVFYIFIFIIAIILIFNYFLGITNSRFGENEISVYLYKHRVSNNTINEANSLGEFKFFYYNILSYFAHQIPYLTSVIREFNGPYMFGMYELNVISRRLPDFLNLDYMTIYSLIKIEYSGSWQTIIGSFIFDFSIYFTPFIVSIIGYFNGKINAYAKAIKSNEFIILNSLLCIAAFSTIQLGPFYNILDYGTFIWWIIIFKFKYCIKVKR